MNRYAIVSALPRYRDQKILIKKKQSVNDIINEILEAHKLFAPDYDKIALLFDDVNVNRICQRLYNFCKKNIAYSSEPEEFQSTKSPAAIIAQDSKNDCKHMSLFVAGVLSALQRRGKKIDWCYRFASYSFFAPEPEHVFIVVKDQGKEIWIDPVPGSEKVTPVWQKDKKIKINNMSLYRISGLPYAYDSIGAKKNVFSTAWRGVKKINLAAPRGAFLSLVALNVFGFATKIAKSIFQPNGDYIIANKNKVKTLWQDRLGGDWTQLEKAVKKGMKKKPILYKKKIGQTETAAAGAAWVTTASAIIAAFMPLINALLKALGKEKETDFGGEPYTGDEPYTGGGTPPPSGDKSNITSFITNNPILIVGGLAALYFLTKKRS
jgi:hypothetical protein